MSFYKKNNFYNYICNLC